MTKDIQAPKHWSTLQVRRPCRVPGFTLLELLVVVGLVAVLASLAVPSFGALLQDRQTQMAAEALVADLRLARSEAIRRARVVAVCSSSDAQSCSGTAAWREGWLVFVDGDLNQRRDSGEELIRVQQRFAGLASVGDATPAGDKRIFSYHPTGFAKAASQTLLFAPLGQGATRVVCISSQGRPVLRPKGLTECS